MKIKSKHLLLLSLTCLLSSCEVIHTGPNSLVIRPKQAVDGTPWFMLSDQEKMEQSLAKGKMKEAESWLMKGANPNYQIGDKSAAYFYSHEEAEEQAQMLVKHGASRSEMLRGAQDRAREKEEARLAALKRRNSSSGGYTFGEQFILNIARGFHDSLNSSGGGGSYSSESSEERASAPSKYEDCLVTYDEKKGRSESEGYNTIGIRSSRGSWTVTYYFGDTGYQVSGSGNLEGRRINVRFDDGRPASLKSPYGSGYCKVTSAQRR